MHSPSSSTTQPSDSATAASSSSDGTSTLTIISYRDMRAADILAEIKKFEKNGIHYLGNENIPPSTTSFTIKTQREKSLSQKTTLTTSPKAYSVECSKLMPGTFS